MAKQQDPRVVDGICGATELTAKFEWICIRPIQAATQISQKSSGRNRRGDIQYDNPHGGGHHMINRWVENH